MREKPVDQDEAKNIFVYLRAFEIVTKKYLDEDLSYNVLLSASRDVLDLYLHDNNHYKPDLDNLAKNQSHLLQLCHLILILDGQKKSVKKDDISNLLDPEISDEDFKNSVMTLSGGLEINTDRVLGNVISDKA